ncbi:MAG TPA: hypothetical protein VGB62_00335 [Allosphingosinicella sp.]|jgi:drug/metabolite transporter (DMT)-like permease
MSSKLVTLCIIFALSLSGGQILFKYAATSWVANEKRGSSIFAILSPALILAFAVYGCTALLWIYILRNVPLSKAYVFSIAGSALVPLAAWALFREPVTPQYWVGFAFLLVGAYLCAR